MGVFIKTIEQENKDAQYREEKAEIDPHSKCMLDEIEYKKEIESLRKELKHVKGRGFVYAVSADFRELSDENEVLEAKIESKDKEIKILREALGKIKVASKSTSTITEMEAQFEYVNIISRQALAEIDKMKGV